MLFINIVLIAYVVSSKFSYDFVDPKSDFVIDEFRTLTGEGNNVANPEQGSSLEGQCLLHFETESAFPDGIEEVIDRGISARVISNIVSNVPDDDQPFSERGLSNAFWQFGQLVDHDLMETLVDTENELESELCIEIPLDDPFVQVDVLENEEDRCMILRRHLACDDTGVGTGNPKLPRQQVSSYLDGSVVYGFDQDRADEARLFEDGLLRTQMVFQQFELLPNNENNFEDGGGEDRPTLFYAGDIRVNENIALQAIQTLFVLEHNRIARLIKENNQALLDAEFGNDDSLKDEYIYEVARAIVGSLIQKITFEDWLGALYGDQYDNFFGDYPGYDDQCDATVSVYFSTVALRIGHTLLPSVFNMRDDVCDISCDQNDNDDYPSNNGNTFPMALSYFNEFFLRHFGIDRLFLGNACSLAKKIDHLLVDDVRNFLFHGQGFNADFLGLDLLALNVERGRELGLKDYNSIREDFGLSKVNDFSGFFDGSNVDTAYSNDLDNIDPFVGAIAEKHLSGSSVGPLMARTLQEQFLRTRNCDRFWYENYFSGDLLKYIKRRTFGDIIEDNSQFNLNLQDDVFFVPDQQPSSSSSTSRSSRSSRTSS